MVPPKGHRPGLIHAHTRTSSGGSSKNLALHFTQKDVQPPPTHLERTARKTGHEAPPFPRPPTHPYLAQRDPPQPKRPPPPLTSSKPNGSHRPKAGFTIACPAQDEDEWVSSESGAATPNRDSDDDSDAGARTPVDLTVLDGKDSGYLLRVDTVMPRVDTARPSDHQPFQQDIVEPRSDIPPPSSPSIHRHSSKRHSVTRPPSTHSVGRAEAALLRPHPLIRGQSYGQTTPRPMPLAPLTVMSEVAPAQISSSPPRSAHPAAVPTPPSVSRATPILSAPQDATSSQRRTSVSSTRSVATLPVPAVLRDSTKPVRNRTLSAISSSSSSSAALSSLALIPSISRPPTPQVVSYFPPANLHTGLEAIHPLLPPPYLTTHMTVLMNRSPIRESFDRVMRAKQAR